MLYIFLFLLTAFTINLINALKWKLIINSVGHDVGFWKLLTYRGAADAVSYLTPFAKLGGDPLRAYLLKKNGISGIKSLATVVVDRLCDMMVFGSIAAVMTVALLGLVTLPNYEREILLVALVLMAMIIVLLYFMSITKGILTSIFMLLPRLQLFKRTIQKVREIDQISTQFFKEKKSTLVKVILLGMIQWCLIILEFKLATLIIGYDASTVELLLMILAVSITNMIPIPAGLGVLEAGQVSLFRLLGSGAQIGLAFSFILRLKDALWALCGLIFLSQEGLNFFQKLKK